VTMFALGDQLFEYFSSNYLSYAIYSGNIILSRSLVVIMC